MQWIAIGVVAMVLLLGCTAQPTMTPNPNIMGQMQVFNHGAETYLLQHGILYRMRVADDGSVDWDVVGRVPR